MRNTVAAFLLASLMGIGTAAGAECPADALGTSRTIVVDPTEHVRLGGHQYRESLPLRDREVVLTFDDGPLPPYTTRILDMLASECVKATFFMVGRMARGYPSLVRRVYDEGHTIANHSQNHPFTFHKMTVEHASQEIEDGFASLRTVLGDPNAVAPFFRIPGLLRQEPVERYLASQRLHDLERRLPGRRLDPHQSRRSRAARHRAAGGQGPRHPAAARHPARHRAGAADHLARAQSARLQGRARAAGNAGSPENGDRAGAMGAAVRPAANSRYWPRVVASADPDSAEPTLAAPNPWNFGLIASREDGVVKVAVAPSFDRASTREGDAPLPSVARWPGRASYWVPTAEAHVLPVPGRHNFRYSRVFRLPNADKTKLATRKPAATTAGPDHCLDRRRSRRIPPPPAAVASAAPRPPYPIGHQFSVARPLPDRLR